MRWFASIIAVLGLSSLALSAPTFYEHLVAGTFDGVEGVFATDLDGDGDIDLLAAASNADYVSWFENDGAENFTGHTIGTGVSGAISVDAADMDGDGDIDVLGTSYDYGRIIWWENDGSPSNGGWIEHIFENDFYGAIAVRAGDIDQDGDMDVVGVSYYSDAINWYENNGSESFTEHSITSGSFTGAIGLDVADVDRDGDTDIIGTARDADDITWWENDGSESFTERTIEGNFDGAWGVQAADIDHDGDIDILGAAYLADDITWWESDGSPSDGGWTEHTIDGDFDGACAVFTTDMDRDGDVDVICTAYTGGKITWWESDGTPSNGGWVAHTIDDDISDPRGVYAADIDQDGQMDVVATAVTGDDLIWYENLTEPPPVPTWVQHTIDGPNSYNLGSFAIDLDSDGDMDLVTGLLDERKIVWWENDGSENFTERLIVTVTYATTSHFAIDVDSDGDIDVVACSSSGDFIGWWENDGTPSDGGWTQHILNAALDGIYEVYATDLDSDGDIDILGAAFNADSITWWESDGSPGDGGWTERTITSSFNGAYAIFAIDMDRDGDVDVLSGAVYQNYVSWWENDGSPADGGWTGHTIDSNVSNATSVYATDIDYDGDIDVIACSNGDDYVSVWRSDGTPADGGWVEETLVSDFTAALDARATDLDGDGDQDIVALARIHGYFSWWENDGNAGWDAYTVSSSLTYPQDVYPADIDGDGDQDLIGTAVGTEILVWWENTQNPLPQPTTWEADTLQEAFTSVSSLYAADIDGDGDTDVLGTALLDDDITWWENDGSESFTGNTIEGDFDGARSGFAADLDGDGDMDIIGAAEEADDIAWWENDGSESFTEHTIAGSFDGAISVYATDVDGDGDVDVLGAALNADDITWWENDGSPSDGGWTEHTVAGDFDGAFCVYAKDVDSDGDIDILGAAVVADDITWWENNGSQSFTERTIEGAFDGALAVFATDVDGDGDIDVLGAGYDADDITWWENDGSPSDGGWTEHTIAGDIDGARAVFAADLDNDEDVDVISASRLGNYFSVFWNDGNEGFTQDDIYTSLSGAIAVYATDFGEDGDVDILCAGDAASKIVLLTNDLDPITSPMRFKHSIPRNRWAMVGIPVNVSDGDPATLFQDDFDDAAPDGSNWRISRYDPATTGYLRYNESNSSGTNGTPSGDPADFAPGLGYWVIQDAVDNCELDISTSQATDVVNQGDRYSIQLQAPLSSPERRGLIQIANPFNYDYDWRNTVVYNATDDQYLTIFEAAAANWISGYAYTWDSWAEQYVNVNYTGISSPFILDPWEGFWMEQLDDTKELYVKFAPQTMLKNGSDEDYLPRRPTTDVDDWEIQLVVSTADGASRDENNRVGVNAFSADGYDLKDAIEFTPNAGQFVQLYFEHEEWFPIADKFTYDYHAADLTEERNWDFTVRTWKLRNRELVLTWLNVEDIPEDVTFTLTDSSGLEINLRDVPEYRFTTGDEQLEMFQFHMTTTGNLSAPATDTAIPTDFGIYAAYPNPFNSTIRISYNLLNAETIKLKVFDILGRQVAVVEQGNMAAGTHSLAWQTKGFASGVYFARLEGTSASSVRKIVLIR